MQYFLCRAYHYILILTSKMKVVYQTKIPTLFYLTKVKFA